MAHIPTILIVDDNLVVREMLGELLYSSDYELIFAENGFEAIQKASELTPDLVLLDVMMPGMNGFEVCQHLRSDPLHAEVPILMVTALDDRESRLQGIKVGADDFISKPFYGEELRARVNTILRLNRYRTLVEGRALLETAHVELRQAYHMTIEGWAKALELRDRETEGHTRRVVEMAVMLACQVGITGEEDLVNFRRGAILHDIGKMGVPDNILLKNGPLTPDEWEIMRLHPVFALEMLHEIPYLSNALDIPYCHHEKWDGSGYPRHLAGEQIALSARVFAAADVWDALRHDRPYKQAWEVEKVLEYFQEQAGKHFDPQVVDAVLSLSGQDPWI
jgi:putative two-component system response regulator